MKIFNKILLNLPKQKPTSLTYGYDVILRKKLNSRFLKIRPPFENVTSISFTMKCQTPSYNTIKKEGNPDTQSSHY